jgi:manganese/zinc/iron transport system substrate-binding protein
MWVRLLKLNGFGISAGLIVSAFASAGCERGVASNDANGRPLVVATTTMIADLARQIGGEHVRVVGIMKPGVDPHMYDPAPDDSIWFRKADLVLVNGLHLEGRMIDMISNAGARAVALAEDPRITLRESASAAAPDPHVWWNVRYFMVFAEKTRDALKDIDPANAEAYESRAAAYLERLEELDAAVRTSIGTIPEKGRYMITSHDAFYYYGQAYGLEVDAVLGISTDAQARAGEIERLARLASERGVPALFHETSVSEAQNRLVDAVQRLAREKYHHEIHIAGPLYSDSLGSPESEAGDYIGAMRANTRMIVQALGGSAAIGLTSSRTNKAS